VFFHKLWLADFFDYMKQILLIFLLFIVQLTFAQTEYNNLLQQANDAYNSKKFLEALKLYDQLLQSDKSNTEAFFWRGRTKVELKDLEGAKKDFESVLKVNPTHFGTFIALGNVYSLLNDFKKALMYNKKAEKEDSLNTAVFINKGNIYYNMEKYDWAIPAFTKAIFLDPTDKNIYRVRADCYNISGKMDSAKMDLESILKIDSNDIHAKTNLAFCNIFSKDFINANKLYEKLYQTEFNSPYVLSNYGYVKHMLGNSPEGIKLIMKSLEIMPKNSYAYKYLAEIYLSQSDQKKACTSIASFGPELENMRQRYCR
jgi:tetratricopeptide (TPR) repeat protein